MSSFGMQIGWLALEVTILVALAVLIIAWAARREARAAVVVLAGVLTILVAVTAAGFCPLPDVLRWSPFVPAPAETEHTRADGVVVQPQTQNDEPRVSLSTVWNLLRELSSRDSDATSPQSGWIVVGALYLAGVTVAGARLIAGCLAVGALRRRSRPITDAALRRLADSLGGAKPIELRECDEPGLAATVGWWRPVILLPPEWRSWTADECRAVLAHELAHIRHGDYLIGLLARFCQVLHFYHPLVRWLTSQVRWQQEVAADACAARIAGGRSLYRRALAHLALTAPDRTPARLIPAMTGGLLLRRICMLHGTENRRPVGRLLRGGLVVLLAGAALLAATLGAPATAQPADAPSAEELPPFELGYLAPSAQAFVAVRPNIIFQQPGMDKVSDWATMAQAMAKKAGITWPDALRPENVEQIVSNVHLATAGTGKPGSRSVVIGTSSILIRLNQDFDWPAFITKLTAELKPFIEKDDVWKKSFAGLKEIRHGEITIHRLGAVPMFGPQAVYFYMPDRRTLVFFVSLQKEDERAFLELIRQAPAARQRDWGTGLKQVARAPFAFVLDNHDQRYTKLYEKDVTPADLDVLKDLRFLTVGVELGDGRPVRLTLDATSANAAARLEKACNRYAGMAEEECKKEPGEAIEKVMRQLATELLASRQARRDGARLEWTAHSAVRIHDIVGAQFPPKSE